MGFMGQIWRSSDGQNWQPVETGGFGNPDNFGFTCFTVYKDTFYTAAANISGLEIWRSSTGNPGSWERVAESGFGYPWNYQVTGFIQFKGALYVAIETTNWANTAQVWRTVDGKNWSPVVLDGFGDADNVSTGGFAIFKGTLYLGTANRFTGGQVWRSKDGLQWVQVIGNGFGDFHNYKVESLYSAGGLLFAVTYSYDGSNISTPGPGVEVWLSYDGIHWNQSNEDGFGDSCNWSTLWSNATLSFKGSLLIGTWNSCEGGEVWRLSR
jgi:hypothetical protein